MELGHRNVMEGGSAIPKLLLTVPQACQSLSISRSKLYDLISQRKIPFVKLGRGRSGGVRFRPEDLQQFAQKHLVRG